MKIIIFAIFLCMTLQSCAIPPRTPPDPPCCVGEEPQLTSVLGYGARAKYKNLTESEQILLAMRDAKEDAYRNMLERVGVVSLKYTSRKELTKSKNLDRREIMLMNVTGKLRGIRLVHLVPLDNGIYEAKLEADLNTALFSNNAGSIKMDDNADTGFFYRLFNKQPDDQDTPDNRKPFSYLNEQ